MTTARRLFLVATVFLALSAMQKAQAQLILESATLGPIGQGGAGPQIGGGAPHDIYLGARFEVTSVTVVEHIGGHLEGDGDIFGAIIPLSGPTALPSSSTVAPIALAGTTFVIPFPSDDILVPLSVTLSPGWYALVFGSHEFGATGGGSMPINNTDTAQASYFFRTANGDWFDGGFNSTRFLVTGPASIVPEPGSVALLTGLGVTGSLFALRRLYRRKK